MEHQLTFPVLQRRLDGLDRAKSLSLAHRQVERLFGFNDVAIARLKRFARCIVSCENCCVTFVKAPGRSHDYTGR